MDIAAAPRRSRPRGLALAALGLPLLAQEAPLLPDLRTLMNTPVVTASRVSEPLREAPATILVLTQEDFESRGYTTLSEILDDLPGMQPARAFGDYPFQNYMRGFRAFPSDPFLLLVDGQSMNWLGSYSTGVPFTVLPLRAIERVEIVYGPASAVYGNAAFMGVIHVITKARSKRTRAQSAATLTGGSRGLALADAFTASGEEAFAWSFATRLERSQVDPRTAQAYEFTKDTYYSDPALWGGFASADGLGGRHRSLNDNRGFDLRLQSGSVELGFQNLRSRTGYGNEYAADKAQNDAVWDLEQRNLFLRFQQEIGPHLDWETLIRNREDILHPDSYFVDGYDQPGTGRVAAYSRYQVRFSALEIQNSVVFRPDGRLTLNGGLSYVHKDLQRLFGIAYGPYLPVGSLDPATYPYPSAPSLGDSPTAQTQTEDRGVFAQASWAPAEGHRLVLGGRWDWNSRYKDARTLRLGYTAHEGDWTLKAFYGQSYQEPSPRVLYLGWSGGGFDPTLKPERSWTAEASLGWTRARGALLASLWQVRNRDIFVPVPGGAVNLGESRLRGLDLHAEARFAPERIFQVKTWAYASFLLKNEGENQLPAGGAPSMEGLTSDHRVGDLAKVQLWAGLTAETFKGSTLTLLARHRGPRDTVATNPAGRVPAATTADFVGRWRRPFGLTDFSLALRVTNLFDRTVFQPGYSQADAGVTPGTSTGYYSSLLAQPGRAIEISLAFSR
ncbi:MAG TPA: TonB-dependent receptor [Holophagaceae bacterium]|nr:TonB-dependent receptor [Holophagaceae bacterium]